MSYKRISAIPIVEGGTGITSTTAYAPICGGTTATGSLQAATTGLSTSGYVLTSTGSSSLPSFQVLPTKITTIDGNSGSVTGSTVTITDSQGTAVFTGSGTTLTHTYSNANSCLSLGANSLNPSASGVDNTVYGVNSGSAITSGVENCLYGTDCGTVINSGGFNSLYGVECGFSLTSGSNNTFIGNDIADSIVSGNSNVIIGGSGAGRLYTSSETGNIILATGAWAGEIAGENQTLRIGDSSHSLALQAAYIAGITGSATSTTSNVMLIDTGNKLGTAAGGTTSLNTGTNQLNISTDASATTIDIGTGAAAKTVVVGSTNTTSTLTLQSGSGNVNISGGILALPTTTSATGQISIGGNVYLHAFGATNNTFLGSLSGNLTTTATGSTALGQQAQAAITSGASNSSVGYASHFRLTTGNYNCALGVLAAQNYTTSESSNITLGYLNSGTAAESNVLRIGNGTGTGNGNLNKAIVSGIQTITVTGTAVLVSTGDQLGVAVSSRRYKDNIVDMGDSSSALLKLRPVTFTLKDYEDKSIQYGLIAEEVAEVMPSIVVMDKNGEPQTVQYHVMPAMLLNELQKALKRIEILEAKLKG